MVISSNSMALQSLGNYQSYTQSQVANVNAHSFSMEGSAGVTLELSAQSKTLAGQMNKESFGSVSIKASSSVMNVVLTDLQGTVSASYGSKSNVDKAL